MLLRKRPGRRRARAARDHRLAVEKPPAARRVVDRRLVRALEVLDAERGQRVGIDRKESADPLRAADADALHGDKRHRIGVDSVGTRAGLGARTVDDHRVRMGNAAVSVGVDKVQIVAVRERHLRGRLSRHEVVDVRRRETRAERDASAPVGRTVVVG